MGGRQASPQRSPLFSSLSSVKPAVSTVERRETESTVPHIDFHWKPCIFCTFTPLCQISPYQNSGSASRKQSFIGWSFAGGKRWCCSSIFPFYKPAHLFSAAFPHLLRHLAPPILAHFQKLPKQPARPPCFNLLPANIPLLFYCCAKLVTIHLFVCLLFSYLYKT